MSYFLDLGPVYFETSKQATPIQDKLVYDN